MLDKYQHNPAYGGLDYSLVANVHVRNQWQGLAESPSDILFNANMPFYIWSGAVGIQVSKKSLGVLSLVNVAGSYNYVLDLGNGLWSNGLRVGISQLGVDGNAIITPDGIYTGGSVNHRDPILTPEGINGIGLSWELGTYYKSDKAEGGLSLQGLPGSDFGLEQFIFNKKLHATAFIQYKFSVFSKFELLQSILLKSDFNIVQSDITSIIRINGNVFGGIGLRGYSSKSLDAISIILGVKVSKHLTLTYSYDAGISGIRRVNEGSHELLVNYNLQKAIRTGLPPRIIYNPRYL